MSDAPLWPSRREYHHIARTQLGLAVPVHQFAIVLPEAPHVVLVHRVACRSTVGQDLIAMHAATNELPRVAFRQHPDLTAFHDLDVIGSDEAGRPKAELMIAQA